MPHAYNCIQSCPSPWGQGEADLSRSRSHKRRISHVAGAAVNASPWTPVPASAPLHPCTCPSSDGITDAKPAKHPHLAYPAVYQHPEDHPHKEQRTPCVTLQASSHTRNQQHKPLQLGDWGQVSVSEAAHGSDHADTADTGSSQPTAAAQGSLPTAEAAKPGLSTPQKMLGWLQGIAEQSLAAIGLSPPKVFCSLTAMISLAA